MRTIIVWTWWECIIKVHIGIMENTRTYFAYYARHRRDRWYFPRSRNRVTERDYNATIFADVNPSRLLFAHIRYGATTGKGINIAFQILFINGIAWNLRENLERCFRRPSLIRCGRSVWRADVEKKNHIFKNPFTFSPTTWKKNEYFNARSTFIYTLEMCAEGRRVK